MTYINKGPNFIDVHMHRPQSKSRNFMDALFAFWPGLQSHFSPSKDSPPTNSERSCPSHEFHIPSGKLYSAAVRDSLPSLQSTSCPSSNKEREISNKPSKPRLKASEFVPDNSEHMHQLGKMGIQLVTLDDGRVQLMQSASKAETPADAEEGMKFMQEIIEITKTQQAERDY
ncbi:putative ER degradation-enhancing alpha-mannosidase-like protein 3 isoform X2 [Apostichopus japonicus]|uniref:Putative ER degradation-enhancing alpha-mannosidase-like protein 3 isoform X2 n=1 Tax=Stichopus japonicus TaxID=307972 RepID=A0A2G8L2P2_STIJA|nr:putative ER degradation-enhancing alpha-mannosidase-like protein 3 isoform X2 [Apostichopus japonicus]